MLYWRYSFEGRFLPLCLVEYSESNLIPTSWAKYIWSWILDIHIFCFLDITKYSGIKNKMISLLDTILSPRGVVANMLNCDVSKFKLQSRNYIHFQTNTIGKDINSLIPQLWLKIYHYCSSTKMDLALHNPWRLICHWKKKPNQTKFAVVFQLLLF